MIIRKKIKLFFFLILFLLICSTAVVAEYRAIWVKQKDILSTQAVHEMEQVTTGNFRSTIYDQWRKDD